MCTFFLERKSGGPRQEAKIPVRIQWYRWISSGDSDQCGLLDRLDVPSTSGRRVVVWLATFSSWRIGECWWSILVSVSKLLSYRTADSMFEGVLCIYKLEKSIYDKVKKYENIQTLNCLCFALWIVFVLQFVIIYECNIVLHFKYYYDMCRKAW